ncbi:12309_t:CDS:2, partial [Entrophospora sp. SA101]
MLQAHTLKIPPGIKPEEIEDRTRSKTSFVQQKYPKQWYQHRQHHDVCEVDNSGIEGPSGINVCKKCNSQFSKTSSVTTLRRHLKQIHSVVAPKIQRTLHQYCNDPHNSIDQRKRDDAVTNWIICDLQSINVVEKEEWHTMISAFDPRYRFHGRTTIHDHIMLRFQEQKNK